MTPREVWEEFRKGCGNTTPDKVSFESCGECMRAFLRALGRAFEAEARTTGSAAEPAAELRRELENVRTANHALRVELHVTQQHLAGQQAAVAALARGAAVTKGAHLQEAAMLQASVGELVAQRDTLQRQLDALRQERRGG